MKTGQSISKNFEIEKKIETLDELWQALNKPSIYWRFRIMPSGFIRSMQFHFIGMQLGQFYTIRRKQS